MFISVVSPRHGNGQTITAVNLSAALAGILKKSAVIVDLNRSYLDLEYYLSASKVTKGLDNFTCLLRSGLLSEDTFYACTNRITDSIDIMSSNICSEIHPAEVLELKKYLGRFYGICVFDTGGLTHKLSRTFMQNSDCIVAVLPPHKHAITQFIEEKPYSIYGSRLFLVVNKYMPEYGRKKISYRQAEIMESLVKGGFDPKRVIFMEFDPDLKNESDSHSVLSFILGDQNSRKPYVESLHSLCKGILNEGEEEISLKTAGTNVFERFKDLWNSWMYSAGHMGRRGNI